ncbi:MAG TPA: SRPBCC family protein [Humibacter sp.]|nr:SRPBCC family protein [Humibacter sp.]
MSVNYRLVHVTPERLFEVLADGWSYSTWVVGTSRIRAVSANWPEPGAALHHSFGLWPLVIDDVTRSLAWEAPRRLVLQAHGRAVGVAQVHIDVQPHARGCVVRMTEDATAGPARLIPRLVRDALGRARNREALRRLAYRAEARTDG